MKQQVSATPLMRARWRAAAWSIGVLGATAWLAAPAQAGELVHGSLASGLGRGSTIDVGSASLTLKGAIGVGTVWRASRPDPALTGAAYAMQTLNDGNLNYRRGDVVSSALDTYWQASLRYGRLGAVLSAKGWYDYALMHRAVPHGNTPNGYQPERPLSDHGFVPAGKFANALLDEAYLYGNFAWRNQALLLRAGRQMIPWSTPTTIGGGLQQVNAIDYAALGRASSIGEAAMTPALALYARLALTPKWSIDAYQQFQFEPNTFPGCGTFYSTSDYAQPGCDKLTLNGAILSALGGVPLSTGDLAAASHPLDFIRRGANALPSSKQFGASASYVWDGVGQLGVYYARISQRSSVTQVVRTGPGVLTPAAANLGLAVPDGLASYYQRRYLGGTNLFGLNLKARLPDRTEVYAEYTYRPHQPISWNGTDFTTGLQGGGGPLAYLASTPTGYLARGHDEFPVSQISLGASKTLGGWLGGRATVSGEVGFKRVFGLPDTATMRYGRVGFGMAPSAASPTCSRGGASCAREGFVTPSAWGGRFRLENVYAGSADGWTLRPSLTLSYDVRGYSYDGVFTEGRYAALATLRGEYGQRYYYELSYLRTGAGVYNVMRDRSLMRLGGGVRF